MQKMCSWNLVMHQVISRLQQDFEVTTQPWPECSFACLFVCLFVNLSVCNYSKSMKVSSSIFKAVRFNRKKEF